MSKQKTALKRNIGTLLLTLYGIGNIVGAGVYVLIGKVAGPAGYLAVLSFAIAALVAFCSALSYAELAARYPVSAGVSVYLHNAFKARRLSTIVGLMLVGAGMITVATLVQGFSGYFSTLVSINPALIMSIVLLLLLSVALRGIKESVGLAAIMTIIEIGGLLLLVGSILAHQPNALNIFTSNAAQALGNLNLSMLPGIMSGAFIAFYAFVGFEDMINIAEEVKHPKRAYPRAIIISMGVVTILYSLVAITALSVMTPSQLSDSTAPLADAYVAATSNSALLITVVGLIATLNGVLANLVMGSRILYGLSKQDWIPKFFKRISASGVPARALILVGGGALVFSLLIPIERLAQTTSLLLLFVFFAVNISLIVIRRRDKAGVTLRISPRFMPWLGTLASGGLLSAQIISLVS